MYMTSSKHKKGSDIKVSADENAAAVIRRINDAEFSLPPRVFAISALRAQNTSKNAAAPNPSSEYRNQRTKMNAAGNISHARIRSPFEYEGLGRAGCSEGCSAYCIESEDGEFDVVVNLL